MEESIATLESPRFEERKSFLLAGLSERYQYPKIDGIPGQWQRFAPHIGKIPSQIGGMTYGVCFNMDASANMDYLCGVEVSEEAAPSAPLSQLRIAEQRYAVFRHRDHISKIRNTWDAIFRHWAGTSGYTIATAPQFEAYGPEFNPQTGNGGVEIWIPVRR